MHFWLRLINYQTCHIWVFYKMDLVFFIKSTKIGVFYQYGYIDITKNRDPCSHSHWTQHYFEYNTYIYTTTLPFRTHANIRIAPISHKGTRAALCKATLLGSHLWRCSGCCTPPGHVTCHNTRLSPPNSLLKSTKWDVRRTCFGDYDGICLSICVRGVVC